MRVFENRSAYVKSPWTFEIRSNPVPEPCPGQMVVEIGACSVCGTDLHIADRLADDWQVLGHEVAGVVRAAGEGVPFTEGDRVALDSSSPCGKCTICLPEPYGRGRPDLCRTPATYYDSATMGFSEFLLTPYECAVPMPDTMSMETASLLEPTGVSIDLVITAEVKPRDNILIIGAGPLGLGAVTVAKRAGAEYVTVAELSTATSRIKAAEALGADEIIYVDRTPLSSYKFSKGSPEKILITSPPKTFPEAIGVAAYGGIIAYIGIAFGPSAVIEIDADDFHFRKLSLRSSMASPGIHAAKSMRLLQEAPELSREMISHRFTLDEIEKAFQMARGREKQDIRKMVMVAG